jgi:cytoskeleton protein RodZ
MDTNSDSDNVAVEPVVEAVPSPSVGKILSEARTAQGLSIADVAATIKFAPRQLVALEADDFEHLPELAFVRGFVRSYARLLHLDEVPLLNALPQLHQELAIAHEDLADVPLSASQATRRINFFWLFALLGLVIVLGLGSFVFKDRPLNQKVIEIPLAIAPIIPASAVAVEASQVSAASNVVPTLPVATPKVESPAVTAAKLPAVTAKPEVKAAVAASVTAPVAIVKLVDTLKKKDEPVSATSAQGPIHLVFKGESWVDIKDKFGKTIFKQVNSPKTEQWVSGRPPFSVVIGKATGVRLFYEGEEVDLAEYTNVDVARLILE